MRCVRHFPIVWLLVGMLFFQPAWAQPSDRPELPFSQSVAPVLVARCLACHNDNKREGGYSLATIEQLRKPGDSDQAILVPGKPRESELWKRITANDPSIRMPSEGPALSPTEIQAVEQWIAEGCLMPDHQRNQPLASIAASRPVLAPLRYPKPLPIHAICFHPNGQEILVGGYAEILRWSIRDQTLQQRIPVFGEHVFSISIHPTGNRIAVASGTPGVIGKVELVMLTEPNTRIALGTQADIPPDVAFAPDGHRLAVAGHYGNLQLFALPTELDPPTPVADWTSHADSILSVAWSEDGKRFITSSRDRTAKLFEGKRAELIVSYDRHERAVGGGAFLGSRTVTLDETGKLRLWQGDDEDRVLAEFGGLPRSLQKVIAWDQKVWIIDGDRIRSFIHQTSTVDDGTDKDGKPKKRQVHKIKEHMVYTTPSQTGPAVELVSLTIARDNLAAGSMQGDVWIWNSQTAEPLMHWTAKP